PGGRRGNRAAPERGYAALDAGFQTDVPDHPFDIVLANPTTSSITASVVSHRHGDGCIEFAPVGSTRFARTQPQHLHEGMPGRFALVGLRQDTQYLYRFLFRPEEAKEFVPSDTFTFHTPRSANATFTFTIQADSHLDSNMSPEVYAQTLRNALADRPDFHVDLGDTFMTDKRRDFREALPSYEAQRYWLGLLCHSAPLFQALGNHDGENGYAARGEGNIAHWAFAQRTQRFPPPDIADGPGAMYSGRTAWRDDGGANYFAFRWGVALCIVLDPFWATTTRARGRGSEVELTDESWRWSLGRAQYDWLATTLSGSDAPFVFVFLHHLVGGRGSVARGGAEAAPYFEWGGNNADGSAGFAAHRPGWPLPIHQLLVQHGVTAVFHGHDHLYVRGERDGLVYQCVPQPGNARGGTRSAAEYGYQSGTVLGSPGHLRVTVGPKAGTVALVRSVAAGADGDRREREGNGTVAHQYQILPRSRK
ncbi:MAG: metallophosphoesterase, partial [Planctomycetes bacterium]|nr:metallophosphoesterase [Planctomycetota bacterium]